MIPVCGVFLVVVVVWGCVFCFYFTSRPYKQQVACNFCSDQLDHSRQITSVRPTLTSCKVQRKTSVGIRQVAGPPAISFIAHSFQGTFQAIAQFEGCYHLQYIYIHIAIFHSFLYVYQRVALVKLILPSAKRSG